MRQLACLTGAICLLATGAVWGQVATNHDSGLGALRDRGRGSHQEAPSGNGFDVVLRIPLLLTDNAVSATGEDGQGSGKRGDVHASPDLAVKWGHQFENLELSTALGVATDRFLSETDQNEDTIYASAKLAFTDGQSDGWAPYVAYALAVDMRPTFAETDDVLHTFAIGVSQDISIDASGQRIRARDAAEPGGSSIGFDISGGRRLSDPKELDNLFIQGLIDYSYSTGPNWTLGFTPKVRVRWYDDFFGEDRRDIRFTAMFYATWTPAWLTRLNPSAELDFSLAFLRNYSTVSEESFSQWEAGPTLGLSWSF